MAWYVDVEGGRPMPESMGRTKGQALKALTFGPNAIYQLFDGSGRSKLVPIT